MLHLYTRARVLWATRDQGATAVEYALIVAVIAMVVVVAAIVLGDRISGLFNEASTCVQTPNSGNCNTPGR
jgi:pilus assembly protein Flp/PilA